jgi:DNA invertase Pin-like site-specific DNA recombinase
LAKGKRLIVVRVYRDIEKYRVKNKLVEPSGTRADRPGLRATLEDAPKGDFDTILAWREDRLYRGLRAMLMVLESSQ